MKKALVIALGLSCALSASVLASPVTDFTKGSSTVDVGFINSDLELSNRSGSLDWDSKVNFDTGITHSIGNNFALQYNYQKVNNDLLV